MPDSANTAHAGTGPGGAAHGVHDAARLDALRRTGVLDTPPEASFDRLTGLAARLLNAPVALVSLVDADRQFFKSSVGLPEPWRSLRQTPLSHSFCQHVVATGRPLIVEDSGRHPLVKDNPAVGALGIAAYAGFPLRASSGEILGSFCVSDTRPRQWTAGDLETVEALAASAATELELRRVAGEHRAQREQSERQRSLTLALLESSREGIYGLDPDGLCTFINHAAARLLGGEPGDFVGRDLRHLIVLPGGGGPIDHHAFLCGDGELCRPDGPALTVAYSCSPVVSDGRDAGVVVVFSDVTERRLAERELRRAHTILRAVFDGTSDAIFVKDTEGRYVTVNQAGAALVGMSAEEILGRDDCHLFDAETAARIKAADREVMAAGRSQTVEHAYTPRRGRQLTLQTFKGPYRDDTGKLVGVLGIARDVTRRKRAEDELKQAKELAESANRAKDRFLAVLSHELRSPLAPVLALASAWERHGAVPEELREDLSLIRRNVEMEVRLIDDLLDMTRIARGKLRLAPEPVDAHELLRHAARTCGTDDLSRKSLLLALDLSAARTVINADAARLQQVMWNLLNNAVKFTPDGGRITVRTWDEPGDRLAVEVADDGIGIEPDVLPRIFDAFEQGADDVTHRFGGLGLGLAICRALVQAMGGRITAASDGPGKGAAFRVVLPALAVPRPGEADVPQAPPQPASPQPAAGGRPLRILLVEDHVDTSAAMSRLLSRIGHHVRTAGTLRAAVDAARSGPVDLVISDLGLPDGSGHDLMRLLRELGTVRGIALSGYGTDEDVRKSRDAGFDTHLTKPTDFKRLLDTIEALSR